MSAPDDATLADVEFDELESVDQYEATFTGTLRDEEITLTYTLESAIAGDEETTVMVPGDDALEDVLIQPETYEFETDNRETLRFTGADADGEDLYLVYVFAGAEDADENAVGLDVEA